MLHSSEGNYLTVALSDNFDHTWITDSGTTNHMTGVSSRFFSYSPCAVNQKIKIADDSLSATARKGSVVFSPTLTLHDVLHILRLSCNLLSVSQLTQDQIVKLIFSLLIVHFKI